MLLVDKKSVLKEISILKNNQGITIFKAGENSINFVKNNNKIELNIIYNNGYSIETPVLYNNDIYGFNNPYLIPKNIKNILYRKWFLNLMKTIQGL